MTGRGPITLADVADETEDTVPPVRVTRRYFTGYAGSRKRLEIHVVDNESGDVVVRVSAIISGATELATMCARQLNEGVN